MAPRRYFGTDGIRGRVGEWPIAADFMLRLGRAAGRALAAAGGDGSVLIGKDTRLSGYMFEAALESGLIAAGANVRLLGPMPTPAVAYLTREAGASGGIVISASHNPHEDNGIKFFSAAGEKLDDALEAAIEAEIEAEFRTVAPERLGKATRMTDAPQRYLGFCRSTVPAGFSLDGLKLVLDCAHGANYELGPRLLRALGAVVHALGCEPDGLNINRGVGSTHPETLAQAVRETGAAIGIAFDGDGDRVVMADARGRVVDGDDLLYVLARDWQASGRLRGPVVGTLMTNFGIESALAALGVPFHRARFCACTPPAVAKLPPTSRSPFGSSSATKTWSSHPPPAATPPASPCQLLPFQVAMPGLVTPPAVVNEPIATTWPARVTVSLRPNQSRPLPSACHWLPSKRAM